MICSLSFFPFTRPALRRFGGSLQRSELVEGSKGQHLCVVLAVALAVCFSSTALHAESRIRTVLQQDTVAEASRVELSRLLYQRGVELERSGNLAGALRTWLNAYNLDGRNEFVRERLGTTYGTLYQEATRRYQEALFDLQYGREARAHDALKAADEFMDGIYPELSEKIEAALKEVVVQNGE